MLACDGIQGTAGRISAADEKLHLDSALSILDTCYDFSSVKTSTYPKISFAFGGGMKLDLDEKGIMYVASANQVCLAFAGNGDDSDIGIFGNVQQKRLQVVYDAGGRKIGFTHARCP